MAGSLDIFEADLVQNDINTRNNDAERDLLGFDDDPFALPAPLPDLDLEDGGGGISMAQPDENEKENKDGKEFKKTRKLIKKSPQPRLNEQKLISEDKGIPALLHICDNIKFKGKGHEASDLRVLLQCYEHWAHRLFPKFPFENVVNQAEKLGHKKLVQNCIKRLRRGEEETVKDQEENSDEDILNSSSQAALHETPAKMQPVLGEQIQTNPSSVTMTPEVLERIRQNRLKALEKRAAAQAAMQQKNSHSPSKEAELHSSATDVEETSVLKPPGEHISTLAESINVAGESDSVERKEDHLIVGQLSLDTDDALEHKLPSSEQAAFIDQADDETFESELINLDQEINFHENDYRQNEEDMFKSDTTPEGDLLLGDKLELGVSQSQPAESTGLEIRISGGESGSSSNCKASPRADSLMTEQTSELKKGPTSTIGQNLDEEDKLEHTGEELESDVEMAELST